MGGDGEGLAGVTHHLVDLGGAAVPPGVQWEEGTASLQVIQGGVARAEGGHDVGRLGAGEGH